ncbi:MAG: LPS assembly protein LptD, partial [Pseudomonadota bacterium]
NGKVIATGHVEASQETQKVFAEFMEYDFKKDILLAKDKVKILEQQGYIIEADKVILTDKLRLGSIYNFTVLFPDKSTLKGNFAQKSSESFSKIDKGYYTSCEICQGKSPIWNITATSTEYNDEEKHVTYKNAVLNYYGVPVFYTPRFSHYTNKAKRRSGFLVPEYGGSGYLGTAVKIPYYFNIAPNQDATLKLITTSKRKQALEGEYRLLTLQGQIDTKGSMASTEKYTPPVGQSNPNHGIRYHYNSKANLAIADNKNIGWNINNTSDKNYLRDYRYGEEDFLMSRVYNNSFQENGYYEVQAQTFQNLRPDNNPMYQTPIVMPLFESKHKLHRFSDGSSWNFDSNLLKIHRYNGPDSNRFSIKNKWEKKSLLDAGHEFKFFTSLRNDIYYYQNAPVNNKSHYTGTTSRTIPEAGLDWSYPLLRRFDSTNVVVSPLVGAVATPYSHYNNKVFSEDSGNISELTDGNLFSPSQYTGIDLIENTPRVSYGVKAMVYYKDYLNANALFGQLYRLKPSEEISGSSNEHLSDYVGRFKLDFNDTAVTSYQYTIDKENFSNKKNELETTLKYEIVYVTTSMIYYRDDQITNQIKNRREIYLETGINDYKGISASVNARKNFSSKNDNPGLQMDPNGFISMGGKVKYVNDCITYSANVNRDFTKNYSKKGDTIYWFSVALKNIS